MKETIPFQTPEAELEYLRSRVLELSPTPNIEALKKAAQAVTPSLPQIEADAIHVSSIPLDAQLSEMIVITESKGVVHALNVLEKFQDWKHEDDFHDYLIELMKKGETPKGSNKEPLQRALNMTLFEVVMPEDENSDKEGLKTLISSMEQFYAGMNSIAEEKKIGRNYVVLEIANSHGSEEFVFYVSVPTERRDLFQKHLLSVFPKAVLVEREHDYNIFAKGAKALGSVAKLDSYDAYPLKTYDLFDYDPLNIILSSFTKIPKEGAGAAIQIIFNPQGDTFNKKYISAIKSLEKGKKAKEVFKERGVLSEIFHTLKDTFGKEKDKDAKEDPIDTSALDKVRRKLESTTVATNVRLVASAANEVSAEQLLGELESGFNQFELPGSNKLVFKRIKKTDGTFFRNFSFRLFSTRDVVPLSIREVTSLIHFHTSSLSTSAQLKTAKAQGAPAPLDMPSAGTLLGQNVYQGKETPIYMTEDDRLRHFYLIGQTGTGKSTLMKNMIIQDIQNGNGVCMIDPHGVDIQEVLANVPEERVKDVIYFDPANTANPMGLNMLEYNIERPEEKTFVVNELFSIFQKLYGAVPESMGPMFEQYFRNATMLVIEDPETGSTLLDVSRVLSNKEYRLLKLSKCRNPIVRQFWTEVADKAGGEAALANIVPYITSKFDVFLANDIMRPIIAQEKSAFNFREIMDGKKILLVNLAKGRLGDVNANLIGLIIVGKLLMAALSRSDAANLSALPAFYLHIDEFQNVTTNSISTILSEARKYKLSLTMAHQFIAQLEENIKNSVFGNVGSMCAFRIGTDDASYLVKQFEPVFNEKDLVNVDNFNAFVKLLINGRPTKPFSLRTSRPPSGSPERIEAILAHSKANYGRPRELVESEIMQKYQAGVILKP